MYKALKYRKSPQALAITIAIVWCSLVFLLVLLNFTITKILVILGSGGSGNRVIINIVVVILFLMGTLHYLLTWDKEMVKIKEGSLVIKKGNKKRSYSIASISSVYLQQNWLGKIFNYGDVKINLNEDGKVLSLSHLEAPNKFINDLKNN